MDIRYIGSSVRKCRYENELPPNQKIQLQIVSNREVLFPPVAKDGIVFPIITRMTIGNPVQKMCLFIEQVNTFKVVDLEEGFDASRANMMKFIELICYPTAKQAMQETLDKVIELYRIPVKAEYQPAEPENRGN